jgi:hypothetical protein
METLEFQTSEKESANLISTGFFVVDMPPPPQALIDSFNNLPRDMHSLGRHRRIRLSQFFAYFEEDWIFALLPQRKYIQSARHIKIPEAGGVLRHREQMEVDPAPVMAFVMSQLGLDRCESYHVNVNQIRVIVDREFAGVPVPEGPHRDGHDYSVIGIVTRHNISGGETQVMLPDTTTPIFRSLLLENQAILIDDNRYIHYATDIKPIEGDEGYRDILVIEINHWSRRAYGPKHERSAVA